MMPTLRRTVIATKPEHEQRHGLADAGARSRVPGDAAVRAHDQAMPISSGAIRALRMSLTTVATSSAPGE